MNDYQGIIFAYSASPELGELVRERTAASLPFCGRYRLIDFALSSMRNAGILDVGVIMQRDYQSLLDHISSGKAWDMSRRQGGLRMLPPFGLPEYHKGKYNGTMEALNAVATYIKDSGKKYMVLMEGCTCANVDLNEAIESHKASGAPITAICTAHAPAPNYNRYLTDDKGAVTGIVYDCSGENTEGLASLEGYIINRDTLISLMDRCRARELFRFHKDGIAMYLRENGRMNTYVHKGYARIIHSVDTYYRSSMDMLDGELREQVFPESRPVLTRYHAGVSTYYSEDALSINSLVSDSCIIEGTVENCIISPGARIGKGARLKNCIIMRDCTVGCYTDLRDVIADKYVSFGSAVTLIGTSTLPIVVPKKSVI